MIYLFAFYLVEFFALEANGPKIFGFSEFLAALALMVLAWTIANVRYRFRIETAPIALPTTTFVIITIVGILTLLTDLWRAEEWLVPSGDFISPTQWQAVLGGIFLLTFLSWAWFAFIKPPVFSKFNSKRYIRTLYRYIIKSSPSELSVIADELTRSMQNLIEYAPSKKDLRNRNSDSKVSKPSINDIANDLLLLIADKRFCRAIVENSPRTVLEAFRHISESRKYDIQIETFSRNIVNEALINKESFLYHETHGYESGLIGYHKPLSHSMFSDYKMVEEIGSLFDPNLSHRKEWDAEQWQAYCRIVLLTLSDYVEVDFFRHSYVLYRAKDYIEHSIMDLYKINGKENIGWDHDIREKIRVILDFVKDAIKILDEKGPNDKVKLRYKKDHPGYGTFYDSIAEMILEIISSASSVYEPSHVCWQIQHDSIWNKLFNFNRLNGPAGEIIKFKVRRLIFDKISEMIEIPNIKSARILGFCLNVLGFEIKEKKYFRDVKALHKAILVWTKKNYSWLHIHHPEIANACLVKQITYDEDSNRLIRWRGEVEHESLSLYPPSTDSKKTNNG